ncbi:hypothetical protein HOH87_02240 [bacterium]|jgi:outer membrane usher protein|nr:hypothetical protein [bacterium]
MILLVFVCPPVQAETYEEMYKRVFGAALKIEYFPQAASLAIDQTFMAESVVVQVPTVGNNYRIKAEPFLTKLAENLRPGSLKGINDTVTTEGFLDTQTLIQKGFKISYDRRSFTLSVKTPAILRVLTKLAVMGDGSITRKKSEKYVLKPSKISGYINLFASASNNDSTSDLDEDGWKPVQTSIKSVINTGGIVWQADIKNEPENETPFKITRFLTEKNFEDVDLRVSAGNIRAPLLGRQQDVSIFGAGVTFGPINNPFSQTYPTLEHSFFLKHPAKVHVNINGNKVRTFELEAGKYQMRNFPVEYGFNDVKIITETPDGKESIVTLPFARDVALYNTEMEEFSYSMGVPSLWEGMTLLPETDNLIQTFYYKKGLTNYIASGAYLQTNNHQLMTGISNYIATPYGPFSMDFAQLRTNELDSVGNALSLNFNNYPFKTNEEDLISWGGWGSSVGYEDEAFIGLGSGVILRESGSVRYAVNTSFSLKDLMSVNLRYSMSEATSGGREGDLNQFGGSIYRAWPFGMITRLAVNFTSGPEIEDDRDIVFNVSVNPFNLVQVSQTVELKSEGAPVASTSFGSGISIAEINTNFNYNESSDNGVGEPERYYSSSTNFGSYDVSNYYYETTGYNELQTGVAFDSTRMKGKVNFGTRETAKNSYKSIQVGVDTALVFADGHFAISQPVRENFAILYPDKTLKNKVMPVNGGDGVSDFFGPAVITSLPRARVKNLTVDTSSLPIGTEMKRLYQVKPSFFNGYAIELSATPSVLVLGKVVDEKGKPKPFFRGRVFNENDSSLGSRRFLASRSGKFQLLGIPPGEYRIDFRGKRFEDAYFSVSEDSEGVIKIGTIVAKYVADKPIVAKAVEEPQLVSEVKEDKQRIRTEPIIGKKISSRYTGNVRRGRVKPKAIKFKDKRARTKSLSYYVTTKGDSLSSIAQKIYGNASMKDLIYEFNKTILKDGSKLASGIQLKLPSNVNRTLYQITTGPYLTKLSANNVMKLLVENGILSTLIPNRKGRKISYQVNPNTILDQDGIQDLSKRIIKLGITPKVKVYQLPN